MLTSANETHEAGAGSRADCSIADEIAYAIESGSVNQFASLLVLYLFFCCKLLISNELGENIRLDGRGGMSIIRACGANCAMRRMFEGPRVSPDTPAE